MRARRVLAALVIAAGVAVTGCSAEDDSGDKSSGSAQRAAAETDEKAGAKAPEAARADGSRPGDGSTTPDARDGGKGAGASAPPVTSYVVRTAELRLAAKDPARAVAHARRVVEGAGGFVSEETTEQAHGGDATGLTSRLVLRVPQEKYADALAQLEKGGEVLSRTASAEDVTDQVVDVESRIASQRASVARVRELMDRAEKLSDVVTLEAELGRRQADLESLLARRSSLKDRTSLSTITLDVSAPAKKEDEEGDDGDPGLLDALGGSWEALKSTALWIGIVLSALLPFAVAAGAVYAVWRWLVRPLLPRRPEPPAGDGGEEG
ncbi:DUF4349 domain-containing protein [Streptomyces sp. NPDC048057]|uniref:DUF4349 domain-containing protein n=1 Tax=Streptomyces sp. NPDC048057 TaxID=3155628 RepID=UPI00340461EA